jgi:hypothetical protein
MFLARSVCHWALLGYNKVPEDMHRLEEAIIAGFHAVFVTGILTCVDAGLFRTCSR